MASDPGSGLQDVHARMVICQAYKIPNVDLQLIANHAELIRKGNIDVPIGILSELGELRRARIGQIAVASGEYPVKGHCGLRAFVRQATDESRILHHLAQNLTWQHALWTVGNADFAKFALLMWKCQI